MIKAATSVTSSTSSKAEEEELKPSDLEELKEEDVSRAAEELSLPCEEEEQPEEMDSAIIRLKQALDEQAEYQAIDEGIEEEEKVVRSRRIFDTRCYARRRREKRNKWML